MANLTYKTLFFIFTIYALIHSTSYGIYEIKYEKNKYGGISVIVGTILGVIFGNIVVWIR